ncbi:MAG TPA: AfsR/SARP family transcriptional regulator [Pilimelia sp.]|nr:AfsR/SARP family transcriptional regulator [Pilimelia sp.]
MQVSGARQQRILAALLLAEGRVTTRDQLAEAVWDGEPPTTAKHQLHNGVARIRKTFTVAGLADPIETVPAGYRLRIDPAAYDLAVFHELVADGRRTAVGGNPSAAASTLRRALGLWRGVPLAGVAGRWLERVVTRLVEQRLAVLEECIDHELAIGRYRQLIADLDELVTKYPFRERLVAQQMVALHRCGRRAEALGAYGRLAARLREELGIDPGPDLQRLRVALLRDDAVWAVG